MFDTTDRASALRPGVLTQFVSGMMTDDERARLYGLPEGCRMRENAKIYGAENLTCGKYVWIGENAKLDASGGLTIGDHTSIGLDVFLWSHTSFLTNLCKSNSSGSPLIKRAPTVVGSGCFIAGPTVVFAGTTIGDGCVILPFTSVNKDLPPFSVASGSPAKRITAVTPEWVASKLDELPLDPEQTAEYLARFREFYETHPANAK